MCDRDAAVCPTAVAVWIMVIAAYSGISGRTFCQPRLLISVKDGVACDAPFRVLVGEFFAWFTAPERTATVQRGFNGRSSR